MTPSMKSGTYRVYILLGKKGLTTIEKATCECAAGHVIEIFCTSTYNVVHVLPYPNVFSLYRGSASCTHISALLHALVAMKPSPDAATTSPDAATTSTNTPLTAGDSDDEDDSLPVTSYACQWKAPKKRKESTLKFADANFEKHTYGRQRKHQWRPIKDFDPRPPEYRGNAQHLMKDFLVSVKGKGLGVSVLFDKNLRSRPTDSSSGASTCIPSRAEIVDKVTAFKESLSVTEERIREIERNTREHQSPPWYSVGRFRLTASTFGRILHVLPTTPPDSLVKMLLNPKNISTAAIEWGRKHESTALSEYSKYHSALGNTNMVVCRAGFVICHAFPFLGASPDAYVHDRQSHISYGLVEIKCPYKYRNHYPFNTARESDFCCTLVTKSDGCSILELKRSHHYFAQVQGQMAITERKWCGFVIYTVKGVSTERILYDETIGTPNRYLS